MSYRPDKQKLTDTQIHTHTDTGDDNTRRPKGPRVKNDEPKECHPKIMDEAIDDNLNNSVDMEGPSDDGPVQMMYADRMAFFTIQKATMKQKMVTPKIEPALASHLMMIAVLKNT